jgi:hypothetical protein
MPDDEWADWDAAEHDAVTADLEREGREELADQFWNPDGSAGYLGPAQECAGCTTFGPIQHEHTPRV